MSGKLAVFDFDNTIIDVNSDTFIDKLIPGWDDTNGRFKYPTAVESLEWTDRMNAVFELMNSTYAITKDQLLDCIANIDISEPMITLLKQLKQTGWQLMILSDANTVFIDTILRRHGLGDVFDTIYTNSAEFDANGRLIVTPFNQIYFGESKQTFDCSTQICARNICKGQVLRSFEEKRGIAFEQVVYAGDGRNDYCPGLHLGNSSDVFFVRRGFSLDNMLRRHAHLKETIKSEIIYWSDASDIIRRLF